MFNLWPTEDSVGIGCVVTGIHNLTKSLMLLGPLHLGQRCHPSPIYLTGSQWKQGVDLAGMCVFSLCLLLLCACVCMWLRVCLYLWVTHCGQTPAHRLLVWLMNQYLQGVFEEVYCMPLFYSLKHPVLRLPLHTKEKINPLLTQLQWIAWATVPLTISSNSEQKEKRIIDVGSEKRNKKTRVYTESDFYLFPIYPSLLWKNKLNRKKNLPKTFPPFLFCFLFIHFIWFLSYLWCHTCYHSCAARSVRAD